MPILQSCLFWFGGKSQRGCLDRWSLVSSQANTDLAGGPVLGSIQGPSFHSPVMVLCSFLKPESYRGKDRRHKEGASPGFSTFQNLENKSNRLPRTQGPAPSEALLWGRAERTFWSSSTGPNCHCILQSGMKLTPFRYSNCFILRNHLKGFPIKGHGMSSVRISVLVVTTD